MNEWGDITTDSTDISKVMKYPMNNSYAYTFSKLDEMCQFLENHKILELI